MEAAKLDRLINRVGELVIEAAKLDRLINRVGELVIATSATTLQARMRA
ncbi:hypothetical protein [Aeromonas hydrophila]